MNLSNYIDIIRHHSRRLVPRAPSVEPRLTKLADIRAVLFDIYGTLVISGSGDIGLDSGANRREALHQASLACELTLGCSLDECLSAFGDTIRLDHQTARANGIEYPEVDIVDVWRRTLAATGTTTKADCSRFAVEYEIRANPVWPMPGLKETLAGLRNSQRVLGIVSNAQFFTPLMFPALLDETLEKLGFDAKLSYFSYEHRRAKPGDDLYRMAATQLATENISPENVLYVGNDMLNDVAAATSVGFRTALFAGDERSLRWREQDDRVRGVEANIVITSLTQLLDCI